MPMMSKIHARLVLTMALWHPRPTSCLPPITTQYAVSRQDYIPCPPKYLQARASECTWYAHSIWLTATHLSLITSCTGIICQVSRPNNSPLVVNGASLCPSSK
jgi:hypothetical protein